MSPGRTVLPAWARPIDEVLAFHGTDFDTGLSHKQIVEKRKQFGYNELQKQPGKPLWKLVLEQFDDMLVKVLLLAAVVSFALAYFEEGSKSEGIRAYIEPGVILLILALNAFVGVWQESNAEAALEALKEMQPEHAAVTRDGVEIAALPARELLPGDIVEVRVGEKVPADIRIIALKTTTLRAEQASLTGESVAVSKNSDPVKDLDCELQAKECMLFAGTAISNGSCVGVVNCIGMQTEIGKIQQQIQDASEEEDDSPLKKKIDDFGERLAQVIFVICILVWLINYHNFISWKSQPNSSLPDWSSLEFSLMSCIYYFKIAVALAVAAIPEGLPAVITTCLALGTRKMAKRNAIVRKLPSVETLGCTTIICSDKTGTLTTNQMSVVKLVTYGSSQSDLKSYTVEGTSFDPHDGGIVGKSTLSKSMEGIAEICAACNDARIECKGGIFRAVGAPTEAALVVLAEKLGVADESDRKLLESTRSADADAHADPVSRFYDSRVNKLATLEFDRQRKSMSVIVNRGGVHQPSRPMTRRSTKDHYTGNILLVKGAAEFVLGRCNNVMLGDGSVVPLSSAARRQLSEEIESNASQALRCLAFAIKTEIGQFSDYDGDTHPAHKQLLDPNNYTGIETDLTWLGVAVLQDPPRPEVGAAIQDCKKAGIEVVVITGDNKLTAESICRKIGVFGETEDLADKSLTGRAFSEMSKEDRRRVLEKPGGKCFSRAEPRHKQDIVRVLKEMGDIVAMTGDGVNDAPALKLADIGIAMGITGTDVAKEAADMVLADDNFSTIVAAVEEGRAIYNNMKAFIRYMISSNIGEVACIFLTAAFGLPENLIPVQLLWVNLVTDGPPATALGFNPPDLDIMEKPPRSSDESLVTPWVFFRWMLVGTYVGFATVGAFASWYMYTSFLGIDLSQDGHSTVTWNQLTHWNQCEDWAGFQANSYTAGGKTIAFKDPCDYFHEGKAKASTLSLSVLVSIEMFNALNALSEDNSLIQMPPWSNLWLLCAMGLSFGLHFVILYVPFLAEVFSIVPLSFNEWMLVILYAFPVVLIDEVLKFIGRNFVNRPTSSQGPQLVRSATRKLSEKKAQ